MSYQLITKQAYRLTDIQADIVTKLTSLKIAEITKQDAREYLATKESEDLSRELANWLTTDKPTMRDLIKAINLSVYSNHKALSRVITDLNKRGI